MNNDDLHGQRSSEAAFRSGAPNDDYSPTAIVHWLRAKYMRHGEIEDKIAADMIELAQAGQKIATELLEALHGLCFEVAQLEGCRIEYRIALGLSAASIKARTAINKAEGK